MKYKICVLALIAASAVVHAEGPRVGLEFESEKDNKSGTTNQALTLIPGWEFAEGRLLSRVELLMEANRDTSADSNGIKPKENKLFLRLRHDGALSERFAYYVRGGAGRAFNNSQPYNYAYIEPAIEFKLTPHWAWTVAYREINSIDGTPGHHVGKFITGPSFDMDKNNEFEARYVRGHGDKDVSALVLEYVHKY